MYSTERPEAFRLIAGDSGYRQSLGLRHLDRDVEKIPGVLCRVVVYRELSDGDGFVVTAYFTSRPAYLEEDYMEAVKVFEIRDVPLDWDYDDDPDTLY